MKKKAFFLVTFLFLGNFIFPKNLEDEGIIKRILDDTNQSELQQTANLLMLFVTNEPHIADKILNDESKPTEIFKAKTAVLGTIQKACSLNCSLNQLQSEPLYRIRKYEDILNRIYKKLYAKLGKRYKKILYGPSKGKELPAKLKFFIRTEKEDQRLLRLSKRSKINPISVEEPTKTLTELLSPIISFTANFFNKA
ncbi:hypothetical protein KAW80_03790 [Candidatus Babeliales bacterium]|nr:hypothetical protein [Candidatus Babeliales bacterium]